MSTAYIVQDSGKNLTPVFDYADEIQIIAIRDCPIYDPRMIKSHKLRIEQALDNFDPKNDYVLLIGDPINIGLVVHIILDKKGGGRFLKWDRQNGKYNVINLE